MDDKTFGIVGIIALGMLLGICYLAYLTWTRSQPVTLTPKSIEKAQEIISQMEG